MKLNKGFLIVKRPETKNDKSFLVVNEQSKMADKSLRDKAIDIKGKKYVLVSDRVVYFNDTYPDGAISTEYQLEDGTFYFKAIVCPDTNRRERTFTGHSQAIIGDGMVNKTAAMENAETSAVGRALAMMGIGVIDSIASIDEINKAQGSTGQKQRNYNASPKQVQWMRDTAARVYGLEHQEDIDKAIESILTIPVTKVPSFKVKDAVDAIQADKPAVALSDEPVIDVTDQDLEDLEQGKLPY